jgi:hypothetical protein
MVRLEKTLRAWGTPDFATVLKQEVAQLGHSRLPLQEGISVGSYVTDAPISVVVSSIEELEKTIRVRAGIFYQSVIAGCSCEGDPTPTSENTEYCEVLLDIDKATAATTVALIEE